MKRVQMKRIAGFKLPPNTILVARPTRWGNPFPVNENRTAAEAVELFEDWVKNNPRFVSDARNYLGGKDLACYCKPGAPCHADVLLEIANPT